MKKTRATLVALLIAFAMALTGCAQDTDVNQGSGTGDPAAGGSIAQDYDLSGETYIVGSKEFTEQRILGHIALAAIQAAGGEVSDKTGISGSATVRAALESGEIDLYWEYTGTGWVNYLGQTTEDLPDDLFAAIQEADAENGITWIGPSPLNNSYGLAVKSELAEAEGLMTMSDIRPFLDANPSENTICAASEFLQRDDGLPGLEATYDVSFSVVELELALIYTQIGSQCVFGEIFTTDARVSANDLQPLEDDLQFFVPFNAAMTARTEVVERNADFEALFAELAEALNNEKMMELNGMVDLEGATEAEAARQFLQDEGFID
ncbi:MAG: glycine betaine ABC transporter substrate-binding protein [Brooklawnia sp.]|jgi:osmoprotectant transport system substrate-binding protein